MAAAASSSPPEPGSVCVVSIMRGASYRDGPYPGAALRANKVAYCKRCGYRCILLEDEYATDRSPGWDKLLALRDALRTNCSLALWADADVVVLRPVQLAPLAARTPIAATKDYYGFNTGLMLLARSPQADRLLRISWEQRAFVPNHLGAEQSAVRYALHLEPSFRSRTTIYMNLVRYPAQLSMSAKLKWNRTLRLASPFFHTAGCSMSNKAGTCADWLRYQLELAQRNWEGQPSVGCLAMGDDQMLPRPLKGSDSFIPFGQGRDVVINSEDATKNERAAVDRVEKRACEYAGRQEVCAARAKRVRDRGNASRALSTLVDTALGEARIEPANGAPHAPLAQPAAATGGSVRAWARATDIAGIANGEVLRSLELLGDTMKDLAALSDDDWDRTLKPLRLKLGQQRRVQAAVRMLHRT